MSWSGLRDELQELFGELSERRGERFIALQRNYTNRQLRPSKVWWNQKRSARRLMARSNRVCADPRCCKTFAGRRSDSKYCSHRCLNNWRATRYQRRRRGMPELVVRLPGRWGAK